MTAASQSPSAASVRHQEVTRLLQKGDLNGAGTVCDRLTTEFPEHLPAWHSASFIALCRGQIADASQMIRRALAGSPSDPRYLLQQSRVLAAERRLADSCETAAAAESAAAHDPQLLDAIGSFYSSI